MQCTENWRDGTCISRNYCQMSADEPNSLNQCLNQALWQEKRKSLILKIRCMLNQASVSTVTAKARQSEGASGAQRTETPASKSGRGQVRTQRIAHADANGGARRLVDTVERLSRRACAHAGGWHHNHMHIHTAYLVCVAGQF